MNIRLKRTPGLYVVGFMAAGKTTVGRLVAHRLGWNFFDTDEEIENGEKISISELFRTRGEEEFRRIENGVIRQHVEWIGHGRPTVLALGGGAFCRKENRDLLLESGVAVWLDCPFETVQRRVAPTSHRPLARDPGNFAALYEERREAYSLADIRIPIESDDPARAVDAILNDPLLK